MAEGNKKNGIGRRFKNWIQGISGNDPDNDPVPPPAPVRRNKRQEREEKKQQEKPENQISRAEKNRIEKEKRNNEKKALIQQQQEDSAADLAAQQKARAEIAAQEAENNRIKAEQDAQRQKEKQEAEKAKLEQEQQKLAAVNAAKTTPPTATVKKAPPVLPTPVPAAPIASKLTPPVPQPSAPVAPKPAPRLAPVKPVVDLNTDATAVGISSQAGKTLGELLARAEDPKNRKQIEDRQANKAADAQGNPISPLVNAPGANVQSSLSHALQEHGLIAGDHWLAKLFPKPNSNAQSNAALSSSLAGNSGPGSGNVGGSGNGGSPPNVPPASPPASPPSGNGRGTSRRGFGTRYPNRPVLHTADGDSGQDGWNNAYRPHMRNDGGMSTDARGPLFKSGALETGHDVAGALKEQYRHVKGFDVNYIEGGEGRSGSFVITRKGFSPIEYSYESGKIGDRIYAVGRGKLFTDQYLYDTDQYNGAEDPTLRGFKRVTAQQRVLNTLIGALGENAEVDKGEFQNRLEVSTGHLMGLPGFSSFGDLRNNARLRRIVANTFSFGLSENYQQKLKDENPKENDIKNVFKRKLQSIGSSLSRLGYLQGAAGSTSGVMKGNGSEFDFDSNTYVETEEAENEIVITHAAYNASQVQNRRATKTGIVLETPTRKQNAAGVFVDDEATRQKGIEKVDKQGNIFRENYLPEDEGIEFYSAGGQTGYNVIEVLAGPGDDAGAGSGIASVDMVNLNVYTDRKYVRQDFDSGFDLVNAQFEGAGIRGDYNQGGGSIIRDSDDTDNPDTHVMRFNRMGLQGGRVLKDDQDRAVYDISLGYNSDTIRMLRDLRNSGQVDLLRQFDDANLSEIFSVETKVAQGKLRRQARESAEGMAGVETASGRQWQDGEREKYVAEQAELDYRKRVADTSLGGNVTNVRNAERIQEEVAKYVQNKKEHEGKVVVRSSSRLGGGTSGQTTLGWEAQYRIDPVANKTQDQKEATRGKFFNVTPQMRHGTKDERHLLENEAYESMQQMKEKIAEAAFGNEEAERYIYKTTGKGKDRKFALQDESIGDLVVNGQYTNRVLKNLKSSQDFFGAMQGVRKSIEKQANNQGIENYEAVSKNAARIAVRSKQSTWDASNEKERRGILEDLASYRYGGKKTAEYKAFENQMRATKMDSADALSMWKEQSIAAYKAAGENVRRVDPLIKQARQNQQDLRQKSLTLAKDVYQSSFGKWNSQRRKQAESQIDSQTLNDLFKEGNSPVLAKMTAADATKNFGAYGRSVLIGSFHAKQSFFQPMRDIVRAEYGDDAEKAIREINEGDLEKAQRVFAAVLKAAPRVYKAGTNPQIQRLTKEANRLAGSSIDTEPFREIYESGSYSSAAAKASGVEIDNPNKEEGEAGHKDWYWGKHMQVVQAVSNDLYERATKAGVSVDKRRLDLLVMTHDLTKAMGVNDKDPALVRQTLQDNLSKLGYSQDEIDFQIEANQHMEDLKKDPTNNAHMSMEALMVSYADQASHATNSEKGKGITGFLHVFDRLTNPNGIQEQKDRANREKVLEKDKNKALGLQLRAPQILQGIGSEPSRLSRSLRNNGELTVEGGMADYVNNLPVVRQILNIADRIQTMRSETHLETNVHPDDSDTGQAAFPKFSLGVSMEYTGGGRVTAEGLKALAKQMPEVYEEIIKTQEGQPGVYDILFASGKNKDADFGGRDAITFNPSDISNLDVIDSSESQEAQFKGLQKEFQKLVSDSTTPHQADSLMRLTTETGENEYYVANPLSLRGYEQTGYGEAYTALVRAYKENSSAASIKQAQKVLEEQEQVFFASDETSRKGLGSIRERVNTFFDRYTADDDVADNEMVVGMRQVRLMAEQASKASGFSVTTGDIIEQLRSKEGMFGTVVRMPEVSEGIHTVRMRFDENMRDNQLSKVSRYFNALFFGDQDADPQMTLGLGKWVKGAGGETKWEEYKGARSAWENAPSGSLAAISSISRGLSVKDFKKMSGAAIDTSREVMKNRLETGYYDDKTRQEIEASFDVSSGKMTEGGQYQKEFLKIAHEGLVFGAEHELRDASGKGTGKKLTIAPLVSKTGETFNARGERVKEGKDQNILSEEKSDKEKAHTVSALIKKFSSLTREEVDYARIGATATTNDMAKKGMGIYNMIKSVNEMMDNDHMAMVERALSPSGESFLDDLSTAEDRSKKSYKFVGNISQKAKEGGVMEYQRAIDFAIAGPKVSEVSKKFSTIDLNKFQDKEKVHLREGFSAFAQESTNMPVETIASWFGDSEESVRGIAENLQAWHDSGRKGDGYDNALAIAQRTTKSKFMRTMAAAAYKNTESILSNPLKYLRLNREDRTKLKFRYDQLQGSQVQEDAVKIGTFGFKGNAVVGIASFMANHMLPIAQSKGFKYANAKGQALSEFIQKIGRAVGRKNPSAVDLRTPGRGETDDQTVNSTGAQASAAASPGNLSATSANASGENRVDVGPSVSAESVETFNRTMGRIGNDVTREEKSSGAWTISPSQLHDLSEGTGTATGAMTSGDVGFLNRLFKSASSVFGNLTEKQKDDRQFSLLGDSSEFPRGGVVRSISPGFELGDRLEDAVFNDKDYVQDVGYRTKDPLYFETQEGHGFTMEPDVLHLSKDSAGNDVWSIKDIKYVGSSAEKQAEFQEFIGEKNGKPGKYVVQQMAYREGIRNVADSLLNRDGTFKYSNDQLMSGNTQSQRQYQRIHSWFLNNRETSDRSHELAQSLLRSSRRDGGLLMGGVLEGGSTNGQINMNGNKVALNAHTGGGFTEFQDAQKSRDKLVEISDQARSNRFGRAVKVATKAFFEVPKLIEDWQQSRSRARQALQDPKAFGAYGDDEDKGFHEVEHAIAASMPYMNREGERKVTEKGLAAMAQEFIQSGTFSFTNTDQSNPSYVGHFIPETERNKRNKSAASDTEEFMKLMVTGFAGPGSSGSVLNNAGANKDVYNYRTGADNARIQMGAAHVSNLVNKTGQEQKDAEDALIRMGFLGDSKDLEKHGIQRDSSGIITSTKDEVRAALMRVVSERHASHVGDLLPSKGANQINPALMPVRDSSSRSESSVVGAIRTTMGRIVTAIAQSGGVFSRELKNSATSQDTSNPLSSNTQVQQAQTNAPVGAVNASTPEITPARIQYSGENVTPANQNATGQAGTDLSVARLHLFDIANTYDKNLAARIGAAYHTELPELAAILHQKINDSEYNNSPSSGNYPQGKVQSMYGQAVAAMSTPEARSFFEGINPAAMQAPGVPELPGVEAQRTAMQASAAAAAGTPAPAAPTGATVSAGAPAPAAGSPSFTPEEFAAAMGAVLGPSFDRVVEVLKPGDGSFSDGTREASTYGNIGVINELLGKIHIDETNPSNSKVDYSETDLTRMSGTTGTDSNIGKAERDAFTHSLRIVQRLQSGEAVSKEDIEGAIKNLRVTAQAVRGRTDESTDRKDETTKKLTDLSQQLEILGRGNDRAAIRARRAANVPTKRSLAQAAEGTRWARGNSPHATLTTSEQEYIDFAQKALQGGAINTDQARELIENSAERARVLNDVEMKDPDAFINQRMGLGNGPVDQRWQQTVANTQETFSEVEEAIASNQRAREIHRKAYGSVYGSDKDVVTQEIYKDESGKTYYQGDFTLDASGNIVRTSDNSVVGKNTGTTTQQFTTDSDSRTKYKQTQEVFNARDANLRAMIDPAGRMHQAARQQAGLMAETDALFQDRNNRTWGQNGGETRDQYVAAQTERRYNELTGQENRAAGANSQNANKRVIASLTELSDHLEGLMGSQEFQQFFGEEGARLFGGIHEQMQRLKGHFKTINDDFNLATNPQNVPGSAGYVQPAHMNADTVRTRVAGYASDAIAAEARANALEAHPGAEETGTPEQIAEARRNRETQKQTISGLRVQANALRAEINPYNETGILGRARNAGVFTDLEAEELEREHLGNIPRSRVANQQDPLARLLAGHTILQGMAGLREAFAGNEESIRFYENAVSKSNSVLSSSGLGSFARDSAAGTRSAVIANQQYRTGLAHARASNIFNGVRSSGLSDVASDFLHPALGTAMSLSAIMPTLVQVGAIAPQLVVPAVLGAAAAAGAGNVIVNTAGAANDPQSLARYLTGIGEDSNTARAMGSDPYALRAVVDPLTYGFGASNGNNKRFERYRNMYGNISEAAGTLEGRLGGPGLNPSVFDNRNQYPGFTKDPSELKAIADYSIQFGAYKTIADSLGVGQDSQRLAANQAISATGGWYDPGFGPQKKGTGSAYVRFLDAASKGEDADALMQKSSALAASMGYFGIKAGSRYLGAKTEFDKYGDYKTSPDYSQDAMDRMLLNMQKSGGSAEEFAISAYEGGYGEYEDVLMGVRSVVNNAEESQIELTSREGKAFAGKFRNNPATSGMFKALGFKDPDSWKKIVGNPAYQIDPERARRIGADASGYGPSQYAIAGKVGQYAHQQYVARLEAGIATNGPEDFENDLGLIYGDNGLPVDTDPMQTIKAAKELNFEALGKQMESMGITSNAQTPSTAFYPGENGENFKESKGKTRKDHSESFKSLMKKMGFQEKESGFDEISTSMASGQLGLYSVIRSSMRASGLSVPNFNDISSVNATRIDSTGQRIGNPDYAQNQNTLAQFASSGGMAMADVFGIDATALTNTMLNSSPAAANYTARTLSGDPRAMAYTLTHPEAIARMDAMSGGGFSKKVEELGIAPIVSPDTGGELFARESSGLPNAFYLPGSNQAPFLTGSNAQNPEYIKAAIEPMRQQLFGNSKISGANQSKLYQAAAGFKYTDSDGKTRNIGGISGIQLQANAWNYQSQMDSFGIQIKQMDYNRERQLQWDFPMQQTNNAIQTASILGGVVHTDFMKQNGIRAMNYSGATVLTQEMKDAGMTEGVTYEGGQIGLAKFNMRMDKMELLKGHQANRARMSWQFQDIARESGQASVRADWQREDFGMQGRQMALARQSQAFDFSYQAREMGISKQHFREDVAFQQRQRQLGFGWQMEDADIGIRRSTGFERKQLIKNKERETISFNMETEQVNRGNKRQEEAFAREEEKFKKEIDHYQKSLELEDESFKKQQDRFEVQREWEEESFSIRQSRAEQEVVWAEEAFQRQLMRMAVQENELKNEEDRAISAKETRDKQYLEDFDRAKVIYDLNKAALGVAIDSAKKQKEVADIIAVYSETQARAVEAAGKAAALVDWKQFAEGIRELVKFAEVLNALKKDTTGADGKKKQGGEVAQAFGGPVNRGESYFVGEIGSEILNIGQDGKSYILPNSAIPKDRSIGRQGSGEVIHIHVMMDSDEISTYTAGKANTLASRNRRRAFNG